MWQYSSKPADANNVTMCFIRPIVTFNLINQKGGENVRDNNHSADAVKPILRKNQLVCSPNQTAQV